MRTKISLYLATVFLASAFVTPAIAQERDHWHDHDIRRFHEHDFDYWRGGHWYHGFHGGRGGWWWMVGDGWYFYPAPIYPYPDPYIPPGVVAGPMPPPPVTYATPPDFAYYCPNPAGYYPYVPQCYGPWERTSPGGLVVGSNVVMTQPPQIGGAVAMPAPAPMPQPMMMMPPSSHPMMPAGAPTEMRDHDDRQLNAFAVQFQNVNSRDPHARAKLKTLATQVEDFRQSLFQRNYNAMDILHDAEGLENRIKVARANLSSHHAAMAVPPVSAQPMPMQMAPVQPVPLATQAPMPIPTSLPSPPASPPQQ